MLTYTKKLFAFFSAKSGIPSPRMINKWPKCHLNASPVPLHSFLSLNVASEMSSQHPNLVLGYYQLIRVGT